VNPTAEAPQSGETPEGSVSPQWGGHPCGTVVNCPTWPQSYNVSWAANFGMQVTNYPGARVGFHSSEASQYLFYQWTAANRIWPGIFSAVAIGLVIVFLFKLMGGLFK
jgi:hypothetical protein